MLPKPLRLTGVGSAVARSCAKLTARQPVPAHQAINPNAMIERDRERNVVRSFTG